MDDSSSQSQVFSFLGDSRNHDGEIVTRIDTHAASVFLAGVRAYKVKRAVKLPYLDYSTLEKRHEACSAELKVNRVFAQDLYLKIEPITRTRNGTLQFDGSGIPVEWAIVMKRFDEKQTLDLVASRQPISDSLADALANMVALGHARAARGNSALWLKALPQYVAQTCEAFRRHASLFEKQHVDGLEYGSGEWLKKIEPLILARAGRGLIRRGHGDLHLGNIALIDGKPLLFDAIEFDEVVATGDVLYDLAFLLMDLIGREQARAANIILNRYLQYSRPAENLDGLNALPFYLSLRASIRAAVMVAKLERGATSKETAQSATSYFNLALELLTPPKPVLVAIGGLSGTGKSVLAADIAASILPQPGAIVLRSDITRKNLLETAELKRLDEEFYGREWNEKTYNALIALAETTLKAGHSAIVDAVFTNTAERAAVEKLAKQTGVKFFGVFLFADLATRIARIQERTKDASDATAEVAMRQDKLKLENIEWIKLDASSSTEVTCDRLREVIFPSVKHSRS